MIIGACPTEKLFQNRSLYNRYVVPTRNDNAAPSKSGKCGEPQRHLGVIDDAKDRQFI